MERSQKENSERGNSKSERSKREKTKRNASSVARTESSVSLGLVLASLAGPGSGASPASAVH